MKERCINLDWLECHCCESASRPLTPEMFRADGWEVEERPYGTRVYEQMFTLMQFSTSEPLLEIRRVPVTNKSKVAQVIDPHSCHIRLHNRTCYFDDAAQLLENFLARYDIQMMRISRIDICLDFEKFDSGDDPQKFMLRYLSNKYSKINQANISSHGKDMWDGRAWNSISWGEDKSMITTKMYNKTMELATKKDKPYIRQAWARYGLVSDFITLKKTLPDGTEYSPQIWRVEFSIKSSVKRWFVINGSLPTQHKIQSIRNTLDCYRTKQQLLDIFASLADHYFHFKYLERNEKGELIRKDRCKDKVLFNFNEAACFYKIEHVATATPKDRSASLLKARLEEYKLSHTGADIINACNVLIEDISERLLKNSAANPWNQSELLLLRQLIARRINQKTDVPISETIDNIRSLMQIEDEIFGEK